MAGNSSLAVMALMSIAGYRGLMEILAKVYSRCEGPLKSVPQCSKVLKTVGTDYLANSYA